MIEDASLDRRRFARILAGLGGYAAASRIIGGPDLLGSLAPSAWATETAHAPELARYPQKTDLILLTDRPPQLETPLRYFQTDLTPNEAFFVRWHLSGIPTSVDLRTYRLEVGGHVQKPLSLSLHELQTKFEPVSVVALCQCAGNSRSLFEPRVPGGQWGNGAMSNARWKGVRLKEVLDAAGVQPGAVQVGLHGLDTAPLPQMPRFEKSLPIARASDGEVIIAYEMNGAPLPMLNGFPVRLVVPGWYATYWVKSLTSITVLDQPLKTFWMDTAYRIPDNPGAEETPQQLAKVTVPVTRMSVHSIFVKPEPGEQLHAGQSYTLEGVAHDGGTGIRKVEVSMDGGKAWVDASLGDDLGKYSWRRWRAQWTPTEKGSYRLQVRATSNDGQQQVTSKWNRSGYQRDVIEQLDVVVL
ncbi:MAG TPA: molybdopterin-dependent oxidoreductase [Candidatus Angelobacter sp.]|jgi:DMSO/TMAO reductase YedYZ molybdopterin-dependent catalytic subunit|nr:molybdopterin-dependent oxidoreductase [Candidatus Angelobacter sp.]